jgi:PIN domain nuclease of toxin-antitoxin system
MASLWEITIKVSLAEQLTLVSDDGMFAAYSVSILE